LKQTIVGECGKGIVASCVDWEREPVTITANEALAAEFGTANARPSEEAETFLRELLAEGPVPAKQVKADADSVGLSWATVRRAKDRLGIKPHKDGMDGGWLWSLPKVLNRGEDAHVNNVSPFGGNEHLRAEMPQSDSWSDIDIPPEFDRRRRAEGDPFTSLKDPAQGGQMTDLIRKRELDRERQRRRRERMSEGKRLVTIEVDDVGLAIALAAEGYLDPQRDDDPEEIRAALERALAQLSDRHA
jgi:hypothetical protein